MDDGPQDSSRPTEAIQDIVDEGGGPASAFFVEDLKQLHARNLRMFEVAAAAGNISAIMDALSYCRESDVKAPAWLLDAIFQLAANAITGKGKRRGRGGNLLANYRNNLIHMLRHDEVEEVREKQSECSEQVASLEAGGTKVDKHLLADRKALQAKIGTTLDEAFIATSFLLRGKFAAGGEEAIKSSWLKVRDGKLGEFKFPSRKTLNALGLSDALKKSDPYSALGLVESRPTSKSTTP